MTRSSDTDTLLAPKLFTPLHLRGVTLANRVVIAPMSQHMAKHGCASTWHLVHVGQWIFGGAALVILESTAISSDGMAAADDLGLWNDAQEASLRPIVELAHSNNAKIGIQISHAGRKAGNFARWKQNRPMTRQERHAEIPGWRTVGPSPIAAGPAWETPEELTINEIDDIVEAFCKTAFRADRAGFDVLELHFAHGYLIAQFLSPVANQRADEYGGTLENRTRLAVRVAAEVRKIWPSHKPLFIRISALDGSGEANWSLDDSIRLCQMLQNVGVDVIDCSSGGITQSPTAVARGLGFQVPYAETIRRAVDIPVMAVGFILDGVQAEDVLQSGKADLIAVGRAALNDPYWAFHAAEALGYHKPHALLPEAYGTWIEAWKERIAPYSR